ncbi:MAG: hypothetical protein Q9206_003956 [Seirophora lacunosa]
MSAHPEDCYPKPAKRLAGVIDNVCLIRNSEFNPPAYTLAAYREALRDVDCNQYGPTMGRTRLKQALASTYSAFYGRPIDGDKNIAVTAGATAAILSSLMAFVEAGDEVIVIEPLFNLYEFLIRFVGGTVKSVTLHPPAESAQSSVSADDWMLDMDQLADAISPRTKMLVCNAPAQIWFQRRRLTHQIINTPHNPLGKVFSIHELQSIGTVCASRNIVIIADEVYEHLHYTASFPRIATLGDTISTRTITIGSVGKTFNATGWRVGFAIGHERLIAHVKWAHVLLSYVASGPAQEAAAVAYEEVEAEGFFDSNRQMFKGKMDNLSLFLGQIGLPHVVPSGAYFLFVNISTVELPESYQFPPTVAKKSRDWKVCYYMCQELGVSSIPGSAFFLDQNAEMGFNYVRFVVCKTDDQIDFAKARLEGLRPLIRTYKAAESGLTKNQQLNMSPPHILLIPGFWEGTSVYDVVLNSLHEQGYSAQAVPLPSTGKSSPGNPSMKDDVASIRSVITPLVEEEGREILLVLHSAGAFLGSMAIEGLSCKERSTAGQKGGVTKIVFLAGAVWEEGFQHGPLPFFDYQGNEMYCRTPNDLLFNDLSPDAAAHWTSKLQCQPASGWDDVVSFVGWKNVPSVYLFCERDAILNPDMQAQMAARAGSEVAKCEAGHCCMLGQPERVVEVVAEAAGGGGVGA